MSIAATLSAVTASSPSLLTGTSTATPHCLQFVLINHSIAVGIDAIDHSLHSLGQFVFLKLTVPVFVERQQSRGKAIRATFSTRATLASLSFLAAGVRRSHVPKIIRIEDSVVVLVQTEQVFGCVRDFLRGDLVVLILVDGVDDGM